MVTGSVVLLGVKKMATSIQMNTNKKYIYLYYYECVVEAGIAIKVLIFGL